MSDGDFEFDSQPIHLSVSEEINVYEHGTVVDFFSNLHQQSDYDKIIPHLVNVISEECPPTQKSGDDLDQLLGIQKEKVILMSEQRCIKGQQSLKKSKRIQKMDGMRNKRDYDKNICGYITKKIVRQFIGMKYNKQINILIQKYRCNMDECKKYYTKKMQYITGPTHLRELFTVNQGQSKSLVNCKQLFRQFYRWFLQHRYLRYLLNEGKMVNKQAYIEYTDQSIEQQSHQKIKQQQFTFL